jgi:CHAT domain-containing protein/Tfp pilus assembly protein PilF
VNTVKEEIKMVKNNSFRLFLAALVMVLLVSLVTAGTSTFAAPSVQTPLPTPTSLSSDALAARAHYKTAFSLYKVGKYDDAIEEFWQVIQLDPSFAVAYRWMAQAYIDKSDPDGALQRFESLLQANPNNGLAYYGLGKVYRDGKQISAKALEHGQKAIALAPQEVLPYNLVAIVYKDMGQKEQAIEMYKKALEVAPGFSPASQALLDEFVIREGTDQEQRNQYRQLLMQNSNGPYADIYQFWIAFTYSYEDKLKAITEWDNLLTEYPNSVLRVSTLVFIAATNFDLKQYDKTEEILKQIIEEYPASYSNATVISVHKLLGRIYIAQGKSKEAEQEFRFILNNFPYFSESVSGPAEQESTEAMVQGLRQNSGEIEKLITEGDELRYQGDYYGALQIYLEVIELSEKMGYTLGVSQGTSSASYIFRMLNDDQKALEYGLRAVQVAQQLGDKGGEAAARVDLANIYRKIGDLSSALKEARLGETLFEEVEANNFYHRGLAAHSVGAIYFDMGEDKKALEQFEKSARFLAPLASGRAGSDLANTYDSIGQVYRTRKEYSKAIEYYQKILGVPGLDPTNISNTYDNLSTVYVSMIEIRKAFEVRQQQLKWAQTIKFKFGEAEAYEGLAQLNIDWGQNFDQALSYAEKELAIHEELHDLRGMALTYMNISIAYIGKENLEKAIEYDIKALEAFENQRARFTIEEFKTHSFERFVGLYGLIVRKLYSQAKDLPEDAQRSSLERAFNYWERAKARTFLDQIGNQRINIKRIGDSALVQQEQQLRAEIQALDQRFREEIIKPLDQQSYDLIQTLSAELDKKQEEYTNLLVTIKVQNPEYASLVAIDPLTLPQVQALLKDTTLVEYGVFDESIFVFVVTADDFQVVATEVPQTELEAAIKEFRDFSSLEEVKPDSLVKLYDWLIAPIKLHLKTPQLVIAPHGILHYLPFQALTDGNHYLVEDYTIAYTPSASVLKFALEKRKEKADTLLAFSNPKAEGLPGLRYAAQEAQSIAELYNTQPLIGEAATESQLKTVAGDYNILHIAAHGEYNPSRSLFSTLRLMPGGEEDGRLEVHEIYGLNLAKADLVVLSACETQLGQLTEGDEIIGLSRAFIYAGTPTIITSLWSVDDQATSILMTSFYTHLKQGMGKAEALRTAQAETRAKFPHPYYWAAFVLTGDPGPTTAAIQTTQIWLVGSVAVVIGIGLALWLIRRRQVSGLQQQ